MLSSFYALNLSRLPEISSSTCWYFVEVGASWLIRPLKVVFPNRSNLQALRYVDFLEPKTITSVGFLLFIH